MHPWRFLQSTSLGGVATVATLLQPTTKKAFTSAGESTRWDDECVVASRPSRRFGNTLDRRAPSKLVSPAEAVICGTEFKKAWYASSCIGAQVVPHAPTDSQSPAARSTVTFHHVEIDFKMHLPSSKLHAAAAPSVATCGDQAVLLVEISCTSENGTRADEYL